jgi:plasmid stability protein
MATITIRNLDDAVQRRLKVRAAAHNRSMESEVREILAAAVARPDFVADWLGLTAELRGERLPVPDRSALRDVDLS